jgi:hypothetical protein
MESKAMVLVYTMRGLIPREELTVKDIVTEDDNARAIATEWYHCGEMVRRDVAVSMLRPMEASGEGSHVS